MATGGQARESELGRALGEAPAIDALQTVRPAAPPTACQPIRTVMCSTTLAGARRIATAGGEGITVKRWTSCVRRRPSRRMRIACGPGARFATAKRPRLQERERRRSTRHEARRPRGSVKATRAVEAVVEPGTPSVRRSPRRLGPTRRARATTSSTRLSDPLAADDGDDARRGAQAREGQAHDAGAGEAADLLAVDEHGRTAGRHRPHDELGAHAGLAELDDGRGTSGARHGDERRQDGDGKDDLSRPHPRRVSAGRSPNMRAAVDVATRCVRFSIQNSRYMCTFDVFGP